MNQTIVQRKLERKRKLINRKRRIQYRLRDIHWAPQDEPMFTASNIHYELADRARGLGPGGIGGMHLLALRTGLAEAIDRRLHLLKVHRPYHESDPVLNVAYNLLAGGTCLEDIALWRNDEGYLDALGARRIPDPTTAGDFCRRFEAIDVEILMNAINNVRVKVWQQQPASFLEEAIIDGDGTTVETTGQCKQGMDINYKRQRFALTRLSPCASARGSSVSSCTGTRTLHKPGIWMVGTAQGCGSSSASMRCRTWWPLRKAWKTRPGSLFITNIRTKTASAIVRSANDRCNQENLIKQLKNGAHALRVPVDNPVSNWAYRVMASLAWTLKP